MEKTIFAIALEKMFEDKAVLIVRFKNQNEETIKCNSLNEAKKLREKMFERNDISYALAVTEKEFNELF
jgi:hypothetical protein